MQLTVTLWTCDCDTIQKHRRSDAPDRICHKCGSIMQVEAFRFDWADIANITEDEIRRHIKKRNSDRRAQKLAQAPADN